MSSNRSAKPKKEITWNDWIDEYQLKLFSLIEAIKRSFRMHAISSGAGIKYVQCGCVCVWGMPLQQFVRDSIQSRDATKI